MERTDCVTQEMLSNPTLSFNSEDSICFCLRRVANFIEGSDHCSSRAVRTKSLFLSSSPCGLPQRIWLHPEERHPITVCMENKEKSLNSKCGFTWTSARRKKYFLHLSHTWKKSEDSLSSKNLLVPNV
jgi:hypothetical protein